MKELAVKALLMDEEKKAPFILLQDLDSSKVIPIWIGPNQAAILSLELQGKDFRRPLTHDLLNTVLSKLDSSLEKMVIDDVNNRTYYASLFIKEPDGPHMVEIDARPSDSIILALKAGAPIFITDEICERSAIQVRSKSRDQEEFRQFTEDEMNLKDFKKKNPDE